MTYDFHSGDLAKPLNKDDIFIITDATVCDNPIVYVDTRFLNYTGYQANDFLGRNCRFLQKGDTSLHAVNLAKHMIDSKTEKIFSLINYRKDNTKFLNTFKVKVFFGADGKPSYFVGRHIDFFEIEIEPQS